MDTKSTATPGELLPDITLPSEERRKVRLSDFRGHLNLVVVLVAGMDNEDVPRLLASISRRPSDIIREQAAVIVIVSRKRAGQIPRTFRADWPLLALMDRNGYAHRVFGALETARRLHCRPLRRNLGRISQRAGIGTAVGGRNPAVAVLYQQPVPRMRRS